MKCEYCNEEFAIKQNFIAKNCICDDDERFIDFNLWYSRFFNITLEDSLFYENNNLCHA